MSSPSPSPRTSLKNETPSPITVTTVDRTDAATGGERNDMNNNGDNDETTATSNGKRVADVPVRKIAGKKISALFEV